MAVGLQTKINIVGDISTGSSETLWLSIDMDTHQAHNELPGQRGR
jgi:hypothetical protein